MMLLAFTYIFAAAVVFDFRRPAGIFDEEYFGNRNVRNVAIGPMPRRIFCQPTYHGVHFVGDEWPFVVFLPICKVWRHIMGYAPPGGNEFFPWVRR